MAKTAEMRDVEVGWGNPAIRLAKPPRCPQILTMPLGRETILGSLDSALTVPFGAAAEASLLSDFVAQIIRDIGTLADPYGGVRGEDPLEYRSIPPSRGRIVRAKVRYGERVRPMPIDDD
jgi:hypothetical protein